MKRSALFSGIVALLATAPAYPEFSLVGLHSSTGHGMQAAYSGVDPLVLAVGVLLFAGVIVYRLVRAK